MDTFARLTYRSLLVLACLSMFGALLAITLNIATRLVPGWSISGLDGYAGYSIAAAFFLALPSALQQGDRCAAKRGIAQPGLAGILGAGLRAGHGHLPGLVFLPLGLVLASLP